MGKIYKNAAELVGNTPLLEVGNIEKELGLEAKVLVKLEYFNPAGSAKDRIALSMKFPEENPWKDAEEKFAVGTVVTGKVARMTDFGAFVELESGVDALLHVSQISRERVEKPQDVLSIGQEITAKVVDLNVDAKKISLSMKALANDEDQE